MSKTNTARKQDFFCQSMCDDEIQQEITSLRQELAARYGDVIAEHLMHTIPGYKTW